MSLSRLLKAQGMIVDTVESGPEALDFLRSNVHPGVIFLDHMMPGMDGFETLSAIKRTAATASVPVVMYTSKEGDSYMGQALALGAIGLLHKPVDPSELSMVLQRVDRLRGVTGRVIANPANPPRAAVTGVIDVPPSLRTGAPRIETAVVRIPADPPRDTSAPRRIGRNLILLTVAAAILPSLWFYQKYRGATRQYSLVAEENSRLKEEVITARAAVAPAAPALASTPGSGMLDTLAWVLNQHGQFGLNEEPLGDSRLSLVRELMSRLSAAGFRGAIRLETHIGEFCLSRDDQGALRLPNDVTSFLRCEVVTYPPAQAQLAGSRQSPAFARFLAQSRSGPVQVEVVSHGAARPIVNYPDRASAQTAGDWNQIARINQRVEIVLIPAR